ncbi:rhomboid family intramembrane serine protease [Mangrovitalea sediminis]|uniref:rhomboid family intramembrane serine protease n=1 Tax=Mangrovitalea sediminis TaxID=1982043 RepID=UPI000BE60CA4|nr:rhomboid family intramembrane serine protease [Mangrovitalea sediminis]
MLIIPAEREIDWRRPPWVTLALILVNVLVFTLYQGEDSSKLGAAVKTYLDDGLLPLEQPLYTDYLQRDIRLQGVDRSQDLEAVEKAIHDHRRIALAVRLLEDRGFYDYVGENGHLYWSPDRYRRWLEARTTIQRQYMDRLSYRAFGLIPAHIDLADLFAYQFLHGGWEHIIGNMVFLFLLGFTVERALGAGRFLVAYLTCGVLSGLVFALVEWGSDQPLVGASGAISGLMGMYVAIFGAQRIRFFYFLGVYFDYFTAPALVMLPVWIAKEVFDYTVGGTRGIAYMAHAGGLAAGAGLVWLFGRSWLQVRDSFFDPGEDEQEAAFRKQYAIAMSELGHMAFETAQLQFEALWRRHPDRQVLLEHLYQLTKLRPDLPAYRERARELMELALRRGQPDLLLRIWQEYLKLGEMHFPLSAEDHNRVLFACLREGNLRDAEKAFERLRHSDNRVLTEEGCRLLIGELEKRQMQTKARDYRRLLQQWETPAE